MWGVTRTTQYLSDIGELPFSHCSLLFVNHLRQWYNRTLLLIIGVLINERPPRRAFLPTFTNKRVARTRTRVETNLPITWLVETLRPGVEQAEEERAEAAEVAAEATPAIRDSPLGKWVYAKTLKATYSTTAPRRLPISCEPRKRS